MVLNNIIIVTPIIVEHCVHQLQKITLKKKNQKVSRFVLNVQTYSRWWLLIVPKRSSSVSPVTCCVFAVVRCRRGCSSPVWPSGRSRGVSWASLWSSWRIIITTGFCSESGVRLALTASRRGCTPWWAPRPVWVRMHAFSFLGVLFPSGMGVNIPRSFLVFAAMTISMTIIQGILCIH